MDFVRDGWMSDRLSLLRGVEAGYAMARAARDGISSASDRYGRELAEGASRADGVTVVRARLPLAASAVTTLYDRIGDAFGWICLALAAGLGVAARAPGVPTPVLSRSARARGCARRRCRRRG